MLQGLNCVHPQFLDIKWDAAPGGDIQILEVMMMADDAGALTLPTAKSFESSTSPDKFNWLWIYVSAGIGLIVIVLLTLCVLWKIRHRVRLERRH